MVRLTPEEKEFRKQQRRQEKYNKEHKIIDGVDYKICNKHHIYFPNEGPWFPSTAEHFYVNDKNSIDWLHPACKKCSSAASRQNQLDNPERTKEILARWHIEHRDFVIKRLRNWRQDNHDHKREYEIDYQLKYPERIRGYTQNHRNHDVSKKEWQACLKVFGYKCVYCGMTLDEHKQKYKKQFHKEHVDDDGYNDLRNCIPSCQGCNSRKWMHDMEEWFRQQDFFTEEKLRFIHWWINDGYKEYIEDKPPYRVLKEKDEGLPTYHFNLWSVDEMRNTAEIIATKQKKKDLKEDIEKYLQSLKA